ncbi:MAG: hypothetical protein HY812_07845 [Planctomycetes bacterium]|nr:hypothetical protein [Planctomycetota bacterium]
MSCGPVAGRFCLPCLLALLFWAGGCTSYSERVAVFREQYAAADFAAAEATIDELLEDETGVDAELLAAPKLLSRDGEAADGDGELMLLEKAMARLCQGDADGAIDLLRRARDELDGQWQTSAADYVQSALLDDTWIEYAGADYEHVLVRVMLALCDLLCGAGDATAYALQVNEKQEEILRSDFGARQGYAPRQTYQRVAIGAYLEGVLAEASLAPAEAARAYERARRYGGKRELIERADARARFGRYTAGGSGVVHVFCLAGRGPHLVEGVHPPTDLANRLATVVLTLLTRHPSALVQAPVKVPVVMVNDARPALLCVEVEGGERVFAEPLLDVNEVAVQQLEANLPWIIARALIRRGLKAGAAVVIEDRARRRERDPLAFLIAALFNLTATAVENADTRNWASLPAQIQAARLELPAGCHCLSFGAGLSAELRVAAGRDSYVVVVRPGAFGPGAVLVDGFSRVSEPQPAP